MAQLGKALGMAAVWLVMSVVLLEGGLRLFSGALPGQIGAVVRTVATGTPYAEAWSPAWQENRDHYYTLRPDVTDAVQYGSPTVRFSLTTHKLWDDGLPPDQGIGFRNPPVDYRVDAVVVGDSFGFCFTELEDCWVNRLAALTGMGMVNLSQPVTGTLSHEKILADFGAPFEPPLVIWQFFGNDFNDDYGLLSWRGDIEPVADDALTAPPDDGGIAGWLSRHSAAYATLELLTTGQWSGAPEADRLFQPNHIATYGDGQVLLFGKLYERLALDMTREANQIGLALSRGAFARSAEQVAGWGGRLVVVIIPTREEVYRHVTEPLMGADGIARHESARLAMLGLCEELALECLDPTDALTQRALTGEALYYADDMHLNPAGNDALARIIAEYLAEARPTP